MPVVRRTLSATAESVPIARMLARGWAVEQGAAPDVVDAIALAVSEAVTNVVVHAYRHMETDGEVDVELERDEDGLLVSVVDHGLGMTPRTDSPGLGLGMPLMAQMAEHLEVTSSETGGTRLVMRFYGVLA